MTAKAKPEDKRERMWRALGDDQREKRVLEEMPKVRIRYRRDD